MTKNIETIADAEVLKLHAEYSPYLWLTVDRNNVLRLMDVALRRGISIGMKHAGDMACEIINRDANG